MMISEYIMIGRKANGEKVYARAGLSYNRSTNAANLWRNTVDHSLTDDRLVLSIRGAVISKYGSLEKDGSWLGAGQCLSDLLELTRLANGWTVASVSELHATWKRWHMNSMRAGCVHQTAGTASPDCEVTGYRYGSEWLFEPLPFKPFAFICDRFNIEPPEPGSDPRTPGPEALPHG